MKSVRCSAAGLFTFGNSAISEQTLFTSAFDTPTASAISCCVWQESHMSKIRLSLASLVSLSILESQSRIVRSGTDLSAFPPPRPFSSADMPCWVSSPLYARLRPNPASPLPAGRRGLTAPVFVLLAVAFAARLLCAGFGFGSGFVSDSGSETVVGQVALLLFFASSSLAAFRLPFIASLRFRRAGGMRAIAHPSGPGLKKWGRARRRTPFFVHTAS